MTGGFWRLDPAVPDETAWLSFSLLVSQPGGAGLDCGSVSYTSTYATRRKGQASHSHVLLTAGEVFFLPPSLSPVVPGHNGRDTRHSGLSRWLLL